MGRKSLPSGFRFHPTDVELVLYYLKRKVTGKKLHYEAIAEVNIYKFSPWDLPDRSCLKSKDLEWFFFCPIEKKYARGVRVKRATENGYWKTTGKDRTISYNEKAVGAVKTLVFHLGHAPKGERTDWVIHEYRILDDDLAAAGVQDTYVLCKVFKKNGPGPKNGAQYGAPFNEADWADDDTVGAEDHRISLTSYGSSLNALVQTVKHGSPPERELCAPGNMSVLPSHEENPSPSAGGPTSEVAANVAENEMLQLLASFTDEDMLLSNVNGINQDELTGKGMNELVPCSDGHDMFSDLGDLDTWGQVNKGRVDISELENDEYNMNMLFQDDSTYLELDDLLPPLDSSNKITIADPCMTIGTPGHENMQQLYSGASFTQYPPCVNELPLPAQGSYEIDNLSNVLQMDGHQIYPGSNAPYDLGFAFGLQESAICLSNLERGPRILVDILESNPARRCLPTVHSGGSSIHIKAEVTHGAGECTNEALSVMMGGSGSCWCTLLPCAVFFILPLLAVCQLSKIAAIFSFTLRTPLSLVSFLLSRKKNIYGVVCSYTCF